MKIPYTHIDAFASKPFTGNQAAVMPLDTWLDDAILQAIGEENNFAETAFIVPSDQDDADYELRWFTPTSEVILCGHATLASGHYVLSQNPDMESVTFQTRKAGKLSVARDNSVDSGYKMSLPAGFMKPYDNAELLDALGLDDGSMSISYKGVELTAIIRVKDAEAVRNCKPDMNKLRNIDVMAIVTAENDNTESDVISRVFVPAWGVDEDSVTGSAHCALTSFWCDHFDRDNFIAYQASKRGGYIDCTLQGDNAILRGKCITIVEGSFLLPS